MITAGYHVCTSIGRGPEIDVDVIGKPNSTICLCFLICFNHGFLCNRCSIFARFYLVQVILDSASNYKLTEYIYGCNAILMADKKNPHIGVIVKMSNTGLKYNCSLAVSVLCNLNGVQVRFSPPPLFNWSNWILWT